MGRKKIINLVLISLSLLTIVFMFLPYVSYELLEKININGFKATFGYTSSDIVSGSINFAASGSLITAFLFSIIIAVIICVATFIKFKKRFIRPILIGVAAILYLISMIILFGAVKNSNPSILSIEYKMAAGAIINAIIFMVITIGLIINEFVLGE